MLHLEDSDTFRNNALAINKIMQICLSTTPDYSLLCSMSSHCVWLIQQITTSDRYLSLIFLLPPHPVCILLFQCSAHAALWESTQGRLSIPINPTPGSSLRASTPPDILSSKADPETDLSHAEDDEAGPTKGGCCCCCCQVRRNLYLCKSFLTNRVSVFLRVLMTF